MDGMHGITPAERVEINQLVFRLGMPTIPSDTNIMAWVLPVLKAVVTRFEAQERRIKEIEFALKAQLTPRSSPT